MMKLKKKYLYTSKKHIVITYFDNQIFLYILTTFCLKFEKKQQKSV